MNKKLNTQDYSMSMPELWKNSEKLLSEVPVLLKAAENTSYEGRVYTYARGGQEECSRSERPRRSPG